MIKTQPWAWHTVPVQSTAVAPTGFDLQTFFLWHWDLWFPRETFKNLLNCTFVQIFMVPRGWSLLTLAITRCSILSWWGHQWGFVWNVLRNIAAVITGHKAAKQATAVRVCGDVCSCFCGDHNRVFFRWSSTFPVHQNWLYFPLEGQLFPGYWSSKVGTVIFYFYFPWEVDNCVCERRPSPTV